MKFVSFLRVILSLLIISQSEALHTRSVSKFNEDGFVDLLEVEIKDVVHGKCTFDLDGQEIQLFYEESNGVLTAKSANPTIIDTTAAVHKCKNEASKPSASVKHAYRTDHSSSRVPNEPFKQAASSIEENLLKAFSLVKSNEKYLQHLQSRYAPQSRTLIALIRAAFLNDRILIKTTDDDKDDKFIQGPIKPEWLGPVANDGK